VSVTKKAPKARRTEKPAGHSAAKKSPKPAKAAKPKAEPKTKAHKAKPEPAVDHKKTKPAPAPKADAAAADAKKPLRKGITIVSPKPTRKAKVGPASVSVMPAGMGRLLDPKGPIRKPLIPSGPKASSQRPLGQHGGTAAEQPKPTAKSPFGKKELEHFRVMLQRKRAELVGDVSTMETQALRSQSGSLSNMPSHLAEQGSEAYDQSLSLDLAAADRKLIKEIDDALVRIAEGTYGICELTGKPIKIERLEELPWARYSIEAARELERQSMRAM
jgi:RNA polymerase-binding protein DksA